jgi:D-glycero-D-manno-heptose 1,7-bisphosphate phosphatase
MKLVILDRDGVINYESDAYIKSPQEWRPIPGSLEAIARLYQAGFTLVVATNQSGVARDLFDLATLEAIHAKMTAAIEAAGGKLAGVFFCPHKPEDHCDCRKPKTGMLRQIERQFATTLVRAPAVGDSWRDIQAAKSVGARAILVRTGKGKETMRKYDKMAGMEIYPDLAAVAKQLIGELAG